MTDFAEVCRRCDRPKTQHMQVMGAGLVCPHQVFIFSPVPPPGSESREARMEKDLANMQAERDGLALALARATGGKPPRRRCKKCGQLTGNPHLPKCPRRTRALAPDARPPSSEKQRGDKT